MKFILILLIAALALVSGHVTITPNQIPSGATTIINFQLSHGCNATTLTNKVVVMFPSNITSMRPINKVGWKLSRTSELLGYKINGVDAFYYNFTWEVDPTIYQGLPDWAFDVLQVRVTVPAASAIAFGSKFTVPVWQYCTGGLVYAWISGSSSSDSHGATPVNGVTVSTAPTFTVLNPADIQFIPSQANVKNLVEKVSNLTTTVQALASTININPNPTSSPTSGATTTPPIVTAGGNTINYYEDASSSWSRADTVAVISIILASLSVLASILLTLKLVALEKQNGQTNTSVQLSKV